MKKPKIVIIFRGIEIKADQIYFNLNTRDVKANYPVVVNLHNAQINANAIETRDLNEIIELKNGVKASFVIKDSK